MRTKRIAALTIGVLIVAAALWVTLPDVVRGVEDPIMSSAEALDLGLERARRAGLNGGPSEIVAEQMTLEEYAKLINARIGTDGPKVGLDPDRPVWVVSMWGHGVSNLPGNPGTPGVQRVPEEFDGIAQVFDARTGTWMGTVTSKPNIGLPPLLTREPSE